MKKILVFVTSLDGKITKWDNPNVRSWSSKSDQDYFAKIWNEAKVVVMGSDTFTPDPIRPAGDRLLIVMTSQPLKYHSREVPGQLEFTSEAPAQLASRFEKAGTEEMLIVGGAHVATSYLKEQLIDELWLTIEPKIFGKGSNFVIDEMLDIKLRLIDCKIANDEGTLLTRYEVIKKIKSNQKLMKNRGIVTRSSDSNGFLINF